MESVNESLIDGGTRADVNEVLGYGRVVALPRVDGLHHRYARAA